MITFHSFGMSVCVVDSLPNSKPYRGRLAPSPTGFLHLGHARTFWTAQERARAAGGTLVLRNEDLDPARSRPDFTAAMIEDLTWFGFQWQEGPDCGGPYGPYSQSERARHYREAFERLRTLGCVYPCNCSRQDVLRALAAPQAGEDEPVYPGTCRPTVADAARSDNAVPTRAPGSPAPAQRQHAARTNWRFRVPDGEVISFVDNGCGPQSFVAGVDFGDFVVWCHESVPSYQLAVVVDDAAMRITEVVRGRDLLKSTARQLLLYRALGLEAPAFFHCPLVTDAQGVRLAKRHDALSLRSLRAQGKSPAALRETWS